MTSSTFDVRLERLAAGERLGDDEIRELAASPDVLTLGMLADAQRRRLHGARTTYLRVATSAWDAAASAPVPPGAGEVRLTGAPETLEAAVSAVQAARAAAGERAVSGFAWDDVERLAGANGGAARVLAALRAAGLDAIAELPIDVMPDVDAAVALLTGAGFARLRLTVARVPAAERTPLLLRVGQVQRTRGGIEALDPLPHVLNAFRPTTGYEDVKMVAVARLAAPDVPTIQVDWMRYGPKLAQVALSFGADDIDGVSASDEAPEGRRRAPLEEIRRNIEAAGFEPVERRGARVQAGA